MEEEKKTNKRIVFSIIAVLLLVAVVAGATYAYFSATANTNTQTVTTGTLTMGFTNGDLIRATNITPISDSEIKTKAVELPFSVTNTGNQHMKLTIKLTDITISDALKDIDFRWGLYNADTDVGLSFGFFKNIGSKTEEIIYRDTIIDASDPDITKNYKLRIWIHDDGAIQNEFQGQTFSAKVRVYGEAVEYTPESCFTFSNGEITDYDADTCGTDVVIPKTIGGTTVTSIATDEYDGGSFNVKNITSVIIPESVTNIKHNAFDGNKITHVTIPEGVTDIGDEVFSSNQLTSVIIPESVSVIAFSLFYSNPLTSVVIPSGYISINAFSKLTDVVLMDGVTGIGEGAFEGNQLTSIEIPSSVTYIGEIAFSGNSNLKEIVVRGKSSLSDFTGATGLTTDGGLPAGVNIVFRP